MDIISEVLKWVLVILIAGFIGQFGKSLSLQVIAYYKKKKADKKVSLPLRDKEDKNGEGIRTVREDDAAPGKEIVMGAKEENAKAVKKALKARVKAKKKAKNN